MLKPEVIFMILSKIKRAGFKPPVNAGSCRGALAGAAVLLTSRCEPQIAQLPATLAILLQFQAHLQDLQQFLGGKKN